MYTRADWTPTPEPVPAPTAQGPGKGLRLPLVAVQVNPIDQDYEVVDAGGLVVAQGITGKHSAAAVANLFNKYASGDGLCLVHLTDMTQGHCLSCSLGSPRSPFAVRA